MQKRKDKKSIPGNSIKKSKMLISIAVIAVLTFIALSPSLECNFTSWDDNYYITNNPDIQSFSKQNIKNWFTHLYVANFQPLTIFTYACEYALFKFNPKPYHFNNLLLHVINSILVFWLIQLLSKNNLIISFITAMLFGIHPLHVESVTWASERKDVLSTFFFLLSFIYYIYYMDKTQVRYYIISIIMLIFSLLSKPMAVSLPVVLIAYDYFSGKKTDMKLILMKVPYFVLGIIFIGITLFTQNEYGAIKDYPQLSKMHKIFIPFYGIVFYLYKTILPLKLSAFYPYPKVITTALNIKIFIAPLIVAFLVFLLYKYGRKNKMLIFSTVFFIITILPVLQIIPVGHTIVSDRYMYIPSIGIFYIAGLGISYLLQKKFQHDQDKKFFITACIVVILLIYSIMTFIRCKVWTDSFTLWNDVLSKYPDVSLAYNNLGNNYLDIGNHQKALYHYQKAIEMDPNYATSYYNRATVYSNMQQNEKALADFSKAIEIDPNFQEAYGNRGSVYISLGQFDKAIADSDKSISLKAENPVAYNNKATAALRLGDFNKSIEFYTKALEYGPAIPDIWFFRGNAYTQNGMYHEAINDYNKVISINPNYLQAYYNRAWSNLQLGKTDLSWKDVNFLKNTNFQIDPVFMQNLEKATSEKNRKL